MEHNTGTPIGKLIIDGGGRDLFDVTLILDGECHIIACGLSSAPRAVDVAQRWQSGRPLRIDAAEIDVRGVGQRWSEGLYACLVLDVFDRQIGP